MQPLVIAPSVVIAAVMAKHPRLINARLRLDHADLLYFLAQRASGQSVCIAVYRSIVIWTNDGVTTAILAGLGTP